MKGGGPTPTGRGNWNWFRATGDTEEEGGGPASAALCPARPCSRPGCCGRQARY